MTWLNNLKIAIIEKNFVQIEKLMDNMPEIKEIAIAKEAQALIKDVLILLESEKEQTFNAMQKIKKIKKFI